MPLFIAIPPGTQFGLLTVLSTFNHGLKQPWRCMVACECGTMKSVFKNNLTAGKVLSCGCAKNALSSERWLTHGHSKGPDGKRSPTYSSWHSMRDRMSRPSKRDLKTYGNLDMDPRWEHFDNFLADMGVRPEGKSLDRIDNSRGYWPDNCRWATHSEQMTNRRPWTYSPEGLEKKREAIRAYHERKRLAP